MKRSPAILFLAALAVVALTSRLGIWQLDRAAQKEQREQAIQQRQGLPALNEAELPSSATSLEPRLWRRVELAGRWVADQTIYLDNRQMRGRPGFVVVTPLMLSDGSAVLVQRGWQPRDSDDRTKLTQPPTPSTEQWVMGRMAPPPSRLYEFDSAAAGRIRQNVDVDAFAAETGLRLRPMSILMLEPTRSAHESVEDGLLRDWPQPAVDVHKHYGYAFQWFALAALTLFLYAWFQIIRPWRARRTTAPTR
jgi:surfeit locus 1 family protein